MRKIVKSNDQSLWVLKAKGGDSSFGGNQGYPDEPEVFYVFDTTVKNHDHISQGDLVVVVDKKEIIGFSSIDKIEIEKGLPKTRYRCPICNTQEHYSRKNISPRHKCRNKHEFDHPVEEHLIVDQFIAHYGKSFRKPINPTSVRILSQYYIKRNLYYSIQAADPLFLTNFSNSSHLFDSSYTEKRWLDSYKPSGEDSRTMVSTKIPSRKGQQKFRFDLFVIYGARCMITDTTVSEAIEASHINPYRGFSDHHPENGLIMRKDLHALFDANLLGVEPKTLRIRISKSLTDTSYRGFDGKKLNVENQNFRPSDKALQLRWDLFKKNIGS